MLSHGDEILHFKWQPVLASEQSLLPAVNQRTNKFDAEVDLQKQLLSSGAGRQITGKSLRKPSKSTIGRGFSQYWLLLPHYRFNSMNAEIIIIFINLGY